MFRRSTLECAACIWQALSPEVRKARLASLNNVRRARQRGAEIAGPVPPEVYEAIRASGPCVYCGGAPETIDHVRSLARGGWEHESNLVPACKSCNFSKGPKLLTEWGRVGRVAYGVAHSPKVAAEYGRLVSAAA
jgi:5-methylcytosine-specific restriction endonuclease McrA